MSDIRNVTVQEKASEKKSYAAPELTNLGSVQSMTLCEYDPSGPTIHFAH